MSSACLPAEKLKLMNYLSKQTFPLLNSLDKHLWDCLFYYIEQDLEDLIEDIPKNQGYTGRLSSTVTLGKMEKDVDTGFEKEKTFLYAMHEHLIADFKVAKQDPWQRYIQRLREIMTRRGYAVESDVHLLRSPDTTMGDGLNPSAIGIIPDASLGVPFGSAPKPILIADRCPCWRHVSKRMYQDQYGNLGAKTHYVLAHLLNHQLNGPGDNTLNVLPLWAKANGEMNGRVEEFVKLAVSKGLMVTYTIVTGDAMKMDPTYKKWFDQIMEDTSLSKEARDIIEWEQELPQYLDITATCKDGQQQKVDLLGGTVRINNFVPMSVPVLTPKSKK